MADWSQSPTDDLAHELLKGCGMIRRSEKRRLVGIDTEAADQVLGTCGSGEGAKASSRLAQQANGYLGAFQLPETVLRLVNPVGVNLFKKHASKQEDLAASNCFMSGQC